MVVDGHPLPALPVLGCDVMLGDLKGWREGRGKGGDEGGCGNGVLSTSVEPAILLFIRVKIVRSCERAGLGLKYSVSFPAPTS